MTSRRAGLILGWLAVAIPAGVGPAAARNCYDGFKGDGCPWKSHLKKGDLEQLSCQSLTFMRNRLFKEKGYCFRSEAAKAEQGNEGCRFVIQALVPLNDFERANIALIRKIEKAKRC